ncbi:Protein unc-79-like protein [Frankliniella fusca]|uniref:Protein unc-79-like protein n=1 Tax=Frankliniella fusca TaxID=407009 RepID=A0AAE1GWN3_9NEOP|nr:Protein unc-79-like protein [Frankliniella fusca]
MVTGCNIVGPLCACGRAPLCPADQDDDDQDDGDEEEEDGGEDAARRLQDVARSTESRPFAFDTREECDLNLGVMLDGERQAYEGVTCKSK